MSEEYDHATSILDDVEEELASAIEKFGKFNSAHEGYAVILEELDELWEEIKAKPNDERMDRMRAEAIQVAAMAIRFVMDVIPND